MRMNHIKRDLLLFTIVCALANTSLSAATLNVPDDHQTIQAAINSANNGDTIQVAAGTYKENIELSGKGVTLKGASRATTIIDGNGGASCIRIKKSASPNTTIENFTIRNCKDGILALQKFNLLNSRVTATKDGIDYEKNSGGLVRACLFDNNTDDGIDLDQNSEVIIEQNVIRDNDDDGIEIRLHDYNGPQIEIVIRDNEISGNDEDGIQLIDYNELSSRVFRIERNLIINNKNAGLGLMSNANTKENFEAASLGERIFLINNTFDGNDHGVTGGDNMIALNNVFINTTNIAMKRMDGNSIAAYNLFFANGTDNVGSNVNQQTTLLVDPLLGNNHEPLADSLVIDAGTASFEHNGEVVLNLPPQAFAGNAPDLGAVESDLNNNPPPPDPGATVKLDVRVAASSDDAEEVIDTGRVKLASSDLELGENFSQSAEYIVGTRFVGINIPSGATITQAYIQFKTDEKGSSSSAVTIQAEISSDATTFTKNLNNIASRPVTNSAVSWLPSQWRTVGETSLTQRTPDIASLVQEVVNQPGWASGNAQAYIITGTGERTAESYNGDPNGAALLHVEYTLP